MMLIVICAAVEAQNERRRGCMQGRTQRRATRKRGLKTTNKYD